MSADLALLADDPSAIERAGDPAAFVVLACERAKSWLTQALEQGDIDSIAETKAQAEAIRVYTAQKQLGHDAEVAAAEIVRRAEHGLGVVVKRGQDAGEIATSADGGRPSPNSERRGSKLSPSAVFRNSHERTDAYAMAAVTDEQFDTVIEEAKAEGDMSRATVARKVRELTRPGVAAASKPIAPRFRDQFFTAAFDAEKAIARLSKLVADDRFPTNAEKVAAKHRNDLLRAAEALAGVLDRLP